jgi:hypothetical protein
MSKTAPLTSPFAEAEELFAALERAKRSAAKRKIVEELSDRLAIQAAGENLFDQDLLEALAREMIAAQLELRELDATVTVSGRDSSAR